ncbi:MAG: hypothetical protein J7M38_05155, partial [Armatimonadetes bacterium]|nr:hypothetical protein [Armatimonadota bacterium]
TMQCVYCRKWELIERPDTGRVLEPAWFAAAADRAAGEGARTMKFLGGTPEPHVASLLRALRGTNTPLPVVWESTMFIAPQCLRLIEGTLDLFIANLRYGNDRCAQELSGVASYVEPALEALREVMQWADVTIRHLVLPGHVECCTRPLAEMLEEVAPDVELLLLMQYVPFRHAGEHPPLNRRLTAAERDAAVSAVSSVKSRWSVADLV